nr:MAG TPA: hypothetical protein [Microviridae sp.]
MAIANYSWQSLRRLHFSFRRKVRKRAKFSHILGVLPHAA